MSLTINTLLRGAKADLKAGRPAAARVSLLQALERFPDNTRLLAQLAEVQAAATGLPHRPFAAPQMAHFRQVRATAGLAAAIEELAAAVRLNPNSPWAQGVLGGALYEAKLYPAAVRHLRLALALDPAFLEAGMNLANALYAAGEVQQALAAVEAVLQQSSGLPPALLLRARLLAQLRQDEAAVESFARYRALVPPDHAATLGQAACLVQLDRLEEAEALLRAVLEDAPNAASVQGRLGSILLSQGRMPEAIATFETALRISPRSAVSFFNLGRARDFTPDDPLIPAMAALSGDDTLDFDDQVALQFGLAKAYEDIGDVDRSFAHLKSGNDLRAARIRYHIDQDRALLAEMTARFSALSGPALRPAAPAQPRPVFIVGMMRSGTTLLEQMLSSHPQVHGAGELEALPRLAAAEMAPGPGPLDVAALGRIREGYLDVLRGVGGGRPVVADKLPANCRMIGLIRKALPEARILHMRRNPVAVCWSIYKTMFSNITIGYAHSLEDTIAYYDLYEAMMAEWRRDFPDGFLDVEYEGLTRDPEPAIRAVLDYCGLSFDPACLAPQDNRRSVRTASVRQVRSGIYQGSNAKWRDFEAHLQPLVRHFASRGPVPAGRGLPG
jgi:tetratricopeptide (TPR) repeat protein